MSSLSDHIVDESDITQSALGIDTKIEKNTAITAGTNTKITYDADGLVTGSSAATTGDITDSTNKRYLTDAELAYLQGVIATGVIDTDFDYLQLIKDTGVTSTEYDYLNGVTSAIQTQFSNKLGSTETATDSSKLGGQNGSYYVDNTKILTNGSEYNFIAKKLTGGGIGSSYDERIILILPISTTNTTHNNKTSGTITASKTGGNVWDVFHVDAQSVYNSTTATFTSTGQRTAHKFVTADYNGIKWLAIKPAYTANPYNNLWFHGQYYAQLDVNGDGLKVISYYDHNGGGVLNAEINNSIADYTGSTVLTVNGNSIYNESNKNTLRSDIRSSSDGTLDGTLKSRISGSTLYLTNNGADA